eukprot:GABW01001558.1.p2 GENE.GABW01001558.1~~GABW01001558.1.p2  ORF type:complete len:77 (-),score=35.49 GABW01001558.1:3-233(-)
MISFHRKKSLAYFDISARSNYNYEKPFLYLAKKLTGNNDIEFREAPALQPAEVQVDEARMAQFAAQMEAAKNTHST